MDRARFGNNTLTMNNFAHSRSQTRPMVHFSSAALHSRHVVDLRADSLVYQTPSATQGRSKWVAGQHSRQHSPLCSNPEGQAGVKAFRLSSQALRQGSHAWLFAKAME